MPYSLETIHPLFIHFPIALLSTGLFFDILAMIFHDSQTMLGFPKTQTELRIQLARNKQIPGGFSTFTAT